MREVELAEWTVNWLANQHWEIYQEVQVFSGGPIADIIAKQNQLIWIVECKLSLSLAVIEQAFRWKRMAHFVSISSLYSQKHRKGRNIAKRFLKQAGIGLVEFGNATYSIVAISPQLNRKAQVRHIHLTEKHKTWAKAGNSDGNRWTPFQETCRKVKQIVEENPGIGIKTIIDLLDRHHYASDSTARSCLLHWAGLGKIKGVEIQREGNNYNFYPTM